MHKANIVLFATAANMVLALGASAQYAPVMVSAPVIAAAPVANCVSYGQETYAEQVMITPARNETRTIPARHEWAVRQELVTPERVERRVQPAVYADVVESKVVSPAKVVYRQVGGELSPTQVAAVGQQPLMIAADGQIVQTAAASPATVSVTTGPATNAATFVLEQVIPGKTRTERKRAVVTPAQTMDVVVPATYKSVRFLREVAPAQVEAVHVPAVYETRHVTRTSGCRAVVAPAVIYSQPVVYSQPAAFVAPVAYAAPVAHIQPYVEAQPRSFAHLLPMYLGENLGR